MGLLQPPRAWDSLCSQKLRATSTTTHCSSPAMFLQVNIDVCSVHKAHEGLFGLRKAACLVVNKLYRQRKLPTPDVLARRLIISNNKRVLENQNFFFFFKAFTNI